MKCDELHFVNGQDILDRVLILLNGIRQGGYPLSQESSEWMNLLIYYYILAFNLEIKTPVTIRKTERPDFIINGSNGLEHVAITDEKIREITAYNDTKQEPTFVPSSGNDRESRTFKSLNQAIAKKAALAEKYFIEHPGISSLGLLGSIEWPYAALFTDELDRFISQQKEVWSNWHIIYPFEDIVVLKTTMGDYCLLIFRGGRYEMLHAPSLIAGE